MKKNKEKRNKTNMVGAEVVAVLSYAVIMAMNEKRRFELTSGIERVERHTPVTTQTGFGAAMTYLTQS